MPLPNFEAGVTADQAELAATRRMYLESVRSLQKVVANQEEYVRRQEHIAKLEESLIQRGDKKFVDLQRQQQDTMTRFFGEMGSTKRGQAVALAQNAGRVGQNFTNIIKEDLMGFVTGVDKVNKQNGAVMNKLVTRLLGGDKWARDDRNSATPVKDVRVHELLEKIADGKGTLGADEDQTLRYLDQIEWNTAELVRIFSKYTGYEYTKDRTKSLSDRENQIESHGAKEPLLLEGPKKQITGGGGESKVGDFMTEVAENALGEFAGKVMEGTFGRILGPIAAKVMGSAPVIAGITSLAAGLVWATTDGISGYIKSADWGVSKVSGVIGGVFGGTDKGIVGAFEGAGKFALIGAGIGSVVPVVGTIAGGLVGAAIGAILGYIGGENIAKALDAAAKTIGEWSDKLLGTSFTLDPEEMKKKQDELQKANDDRSKQISDLLQQQKDLDDAIAQARADGNTQLVDELTHQKDLLTQQTADLAKASAADQESLNKLADDAKTAQRSYIGQFTDWITANAISPLGLISDELLGTNFVLDKDALDKQRDQLVASSTQLAQQAQDTMKQITDVQTQIDAAKAAGDDQTAAALQQQLDFLKKRSDNITAEAEDVQKKLDDNEKLRQDESNRWIDQLNSKITAGIKSIIEGATSWLEKVFSWDYWFGDKGDKITDKAKSDIQTAKEAEARRGQLVASLQNSTSHLFGGDDNDLKSAIEDFRQGKISEDELRQKISDRQNAGDVTATGKTDAGNALGILSQYEEFQKQLKVRGEQAKTGLDLSDANAKDADTKRIEQNNAAKGAALAVTTVDNSTSVTNNSSVQVAADVHNREPSFAAGVAGVRGTTYTSGR